MIRIKSVSAIEVALKERVNPMIVSMIIYLGETYKDAIVHEFDGQSSAYLLTHIYKKPALIVDDINSKFKLNDRQYAELITQDKLTLIRLVSDPNFLDQEF